MSSLTRSMLDSLQRDLARAMLDLSLVGPLLPEGPDAAVDLTEQPLRDIMVQLYELGDEISAEIFATCPSCRGSGKVILAGETQEIESFACAGERQLLKSEAAIVARQMEQEEAELRQEEPGV